MAKEKKEEEALRLSPKRALLVGAYGNRLSQEKGREQLHELSLLVETYGARPVGEELCLLRTFDASTFVSSGKLNDLKLRAAETAAELIIFDDEMSPAQQRNLEKAFGLPVMDRTEVILEVFAARAQTKEARLQIELARTRYQAPRLKRLWTHLSRQAATAGGGAYLKGEGEKQIEIDRRLLKKRIERLQEEIEEVRHSRATQRQGRGRGGVPVFALVGYTNAGKSTLLNALTQADVLVENKLFATLDTTTRRMTLKNGQEILLIDTVGFIRKLPHLLVAAFRSTLEESLYADFLLHVVDASHPMALEQAQTTLEVLKDLGTADKPLITLLNKSDAAPHSEMAQRLRISYPKTVPLSALKKEGFEELEELMIAELSKRRLLLKLRVPQSEYGLVAEAMRQGHILKQEYEENDVELLVELPAHVAGRLKRFVVEEESDES